MKLVHDMTLHRYAKRTSQNRCITKKYQKGLHGDFSVRTAEHGASWKSIVDGPRWMDNDR